jgi:hypothetical protein
MLLFYFELDEWLSLIAKQYYSKQFIVS